MQVLPSILHREKRHPLKVKLSTCPLIITPSSCNFIGETADFPAATPDFHRENSISMT
jgi:hypothetical protein